MAVGRDSARADTFLDEQTKLTRLQIEEMEEENATRRRILKLEHASAAMKLAFELALAIIFTAIAVWNDFFFPLIFIFDDDYKTLPLAITTFIGQFRTDWGMVFASLAISMN